MRPAGLVTIKKSSVARLGGQSSASCKHGVAVGVNEEDCDLDLRSKRDEFEMS